ncbi:hypothetical protein EDD21DRAFT_42163 [Dissophora ornata]|nr:hypothetical protein EDD21DRAFT_42163 [Dissophora ornata]
MSSSNPSPPLPESLSSSSSSPPKQHHDSDPARDINIDMSLEHQLLSLSLGDEPQDRYPHQDQQLPLYIQSPQQHTQPCHPLDRCENPKPVSRSSKKSKNKEKSNSSKGSKRKSGGAFSAISKRFSPSPPPRSLSTPAVAALALMVSDADTSSGSGSESGSADTLMEKLSRPLSSPFKDHTRHHSVSGVPSQDSKRSRSSCASSCSASSSTSSASSSSSCSATSSSSSSSPFFSPSAFYNSLFGNNNHNHNHSINPLASTPTSASSSTLPSSPFATTDGSIKMGSTRQVRSVSCTPSFPLSSLSIPKDPSMVVSDSQSPLSNRSPEAFPLTQARLNPQLQHSYQSQVSLQSILQRSNPVSPTGAFSASTSSPLPALSSSSSSAFSPTALPPLPLFSSSSSSSSLFPTSSSALFSSNTFPSIAHSEELSSTPYQSIIMGAPLPSVSSEAGGLVTTSAFVNCNGNSQAQQMHHPVGTHPTVHPHAHAATHATQSFETDSRRLERSLPNRSSSSTPAVGNRSLISSLSTMSTSCNSDPGFLAGSRRSSKDSVDSVPGVTLDDLVDQLTIPDYVNTLGK